MSDEIEEAFQRGEPRLETLICGCLYVVDMANMVQYKKDAPGAPRVRKIKRDVVFAKCKGVAGLVLREEDR